MCKAPHCYISQNRLGYAVVAKNSKVSVTLNNKDFLPMPHAHGGQQQDSDNHTHPGTQVTKVAASYGTERG